MARNLACPTRSRALHPSWSRVGYLARLLAPLFSGHSSHARQRGYGGGSLALLNALRCCRWKSRYGARTGRMNGEERWRKTCCFHPIQRIEVWKELSEIGDVRLSYD